MAKSPLPVDYDPFATGELQATCASSAAQREVFAAAYWGADASRSYNEAFCLRFRGELSVTEIAAALTAVVARHEALRISLSPDGLTACIAAPGAVSLPVDAGDDASLAAALIDEAERPFDLVNGPLFRARLLRFSATDHTLIVGAHHLICDGYSVGIVVKDLAALYSGRALSPAGSYRDYVHREQQRDDSADRAFWQHLFASGAPALDLPLDGQRPPLRTYASRREDLDLSPELIKTLKALGAKHGASFFVTLLAAYQTLLHRLTGQDQLVVGVPSAGQTVEGDERLVGHCVNMLPIPARIDSAQSFLLFLTSVRDTVLDAFEHQQFTYGSLLTEMKLERDPSRPPLVAAIFNLDQGLSEDSYRFAGLSTTFTTVARRYENFELFFNVIEIDDRTTVECQYLTDLFSATTIRARLASFAQLLAAIADAPETAIGALSIVPDEQRLAMKSWNETARALPQAATIHALIGAQAAKTPQNIAATCNGESLTYAQLIDASEKLAAFLRKRGVKPGITVGVSIDRSLDMLVALLAVMRAGGAYVPIDPAFPPERIAWMLDDAETSLLLVTEASAGAMPSSAARLIVIDKMRGEISATKPLSASPTPDDAGPDDLAYIIFTSGSTGRPKGVLCPHQGVTNLLSSMQRWPGLTSHDRQLAVTTISFDVHVPDLYLPLVCGAQLIIATKDDTLDGHKLCSLIDTHSITFFQATPATWQLLLACGWTGSQRLTALSTGEPLPRDLATALLPIVGSLWNMYGPTETTVYSTGCRIIDASLPIPIGRPLANTLLFIVNEQGAACPVGVPGELLIGGIGVTRGYLKRPDLTAEKFVMAPDRSAGRAYKTGDLARFLPDGRVECLGRNDDQVKVRGHRIELGEIEAALARLPQIKSGIAGIRDRSPNDRRLVAWYTAKDGAPASGDDLRRELRRVLPDYMIPQNFLAVNEWPLTPSGKIDRKKLPSPFTDAVGPIDQARASDCLTARAPGTPLELSLIQRRILALEAERPELTMFNLPTGFRLFGALDVPAFCEALDIFVNRHEAMRTSFKHGLPHVEPRVSLQPNIYDLTHEPRAAQDERLARDFARAARTRMDLTRAPLLQTSLYKISDDESVLLIMAHQSTWDGWSFDIFVKELSVIYAATTSACVAKLPPLAFGYADYALWHNRMLNSAEMTSQVQYWRGALADLPAPPDLKHLMHGRSRPPVFSYNGRSVSYFMPRELADALTGVGRLVGASFFQVLLAAYQILLHQISGALDICVSTPVRGRESPDVENIVGTFVNQIILRAAIDPQQRFSDFLRQVRQTALTGMAHDALPFEQLLAALDLPSDPAHAPLTSCNFSFQDARARNTSFGTIPFQQLNIEPLTAPCDLNFWVKESHDSLVGSMNFASDLFDDDTMRSVLARYDALLTSIVAQPHEIVADLASDPLSVQDSPVATWLHGIPALEQSLQKLEAIKTAAASLQYDAFGTPRLTVHFSLRPGEFITATAMRQHARQHFGDKLVPQVVLEVEDLPLLPNGRIDKVKLLPAIQRGNDPTGEGAAPQSAEEQTLVRIWSDLLGTTAVPTTGNFFELGGHSLLAIQMIGRVERETGVKLNRMAVTLNTLGQIAKTMNLPAAVNKMEERTDPTPSINPSVLRGNNDGAKNSNAALTPDDENSADRPGKTLKLWRLWRGGRP